jgi:ribosomal protein S26
MKDMTLNDRDIFAIYKVLSKAMDSAEFCFEGTRHARIVTLKLKEYVEQRMKEEEKNFEKNLNLNL